MWSHDFVLYSIIFPSFFSSNCYTLSLFLRQVHRAWEEKYAFKSKLKLLKQIIEIHQSFNCSPLFGCREKWTQRKYIEHQSPFPGNENLNATKEDNPVSLSAPEFPAPKNSKSSYLFIFNFADQSLNWSNSKSNIYICHIIFLLAQQLKRKIQHTLSSQYPNLHLFT